MLPGGHDPTIGNILTVNPRSVYQTLGKLAASVALRRFVLRVTLYYNPRERISPLSLATTLVICLPRKSSA